MGEQNPYVFGNGKLYINGELLGEGIPDLDCNYYDEVHKYVEKTATYHLTDSMEFTCKVNWDKVTLWKLTGMWDYVIKYCPNRRLAHLVEYGKNKRVRLKNFYRAAAATLGYAAYVARKTN